MERITIPAPKRLVLRLPAPEPLVARIPAPATPAASIPAPRDQVLTLPRPKPLHLVLPESSMPRVPGIAAGVVTVDVSITGTAVARARAAGAITTEAAVSATAKARAVAAGAITAAVSITGTARPYATGAVTTAVVITGKAVAKLSGAVAAAASITGTAKAVLAGAVTGTATVSGAATARAVAAGAVTAEASITGTAMLPAYPMGMDKSTSQVVPRNAWTDLTGMVIRSGFPQSVISGDKLVAGASMTVAFTARVGYSSIVAGGAQQLMRVVKNGTVVVASGNASSGITGTVTFESGADTLSLQASSSLSTTGSRTIASGAANTYLYWTVN